VTEGRKKLMVDRGVCGVKLDVIIFVDVVRMKGLCWCFWKEIYLLTGFEGTAGLLPPSILPVSSATRALILATLLSIAVVTLVYVEKEK
jgi:hypothetical protein